MYNVGSYVMIYIYILTDYDILTVYDTVLYLTKYQYKLGCNICNSTYITKMMSCYIIINYNLYIFFVKICI